MDPIADATAQVRRFHKRSVELRRELGKGQFGKVYKACIREPNVPKSVAIKVIWPVIQNGQEPVDLAEFRKQAYSELYKMSMLKHENIVKLLGMVESEIPWFVCEYMKDGNLLESLRKKPDLKDKDMIRFCHQIATGMEYLHANKILHKDLAARNILLDGKTLKIADMGLSSITSERSGGVYSINGKPFAFRQAARECIVEQIYTFETDIWAFGVLMYEIWSRGSVPYGQNSTESDVRRLIVDGKNPLIVRKIQCPPIIMSLMINQIFLINWTVRPSFHELKRFFHGVLKKKDMHIPVQQPEEAVYSHPHNQNNPHHHHQQHHNRSPIAKASPHIIEPEFSHQSQEEGVFPRIRSNSHSNQRSTNAATAGHLRKAAHGHGLLAASDHGNFNSASNPDLTRPVREPQDFVPSLPSQYDLMRRRGSQDPLRGGSGHGHGSHGAAHSNSNGSTPPLSSSPSSGASAGNSSWLFSAGAGAPPREKPRKSLTPLSSLDLPYGSDRFVSSVSLYPEFIPDRFHRDRRRGLGASQEILT